MRKGKISYNSLIRSVLRVPFERREPDHIGRDGAFSASMEGLSLNTTVYGGPDAEKLAFYRAFNGALAAGVRPEFAEVSLMLPLTETEPGVRRRMEALCCAAEAESVAIRGGHTGFSGAVSLPVITVVIGGRRDPEAAGQEIPGKELIGRDLVLTKRAGDAGAMVLSRESRGELGKRLAGGYIDGMGRVSELLSCAPETRIFRGFGALLHDVSEGGLYSALYELSEGYGAGFRADLQKVPLSQETVEFCEILGGDPYTLLSTGCMLAAVRDGERAVEALRGAGVEAAVIGSVTEGHGKILLRGGEESFLGRPEQDLLMRLENFG